MNFTRPSPKRDSSCRRGIRNDLQVFPSLCLLQVPGWVSTRRRGPRRAEPAADAARIQPRASSRLDYLEHPVIPRLLGFQIYLVMVEQMRKLAQRGQEPPSVLTVTRSWLARGPAIFLITGVSNTAPAEAMQPNGKRNPFHMEKLSPRIHCPFPDSTNIKQERGYLRPATGAWTVGHRR